MPSSRILLAAVSIFLAAAASPPAAGDENPGVDLSLVTDTAAVRPGEPFRVGVLFRHRPGFHTYYRAPGIVGLPTRVEWQVPEGFSVGELQWPAPEVTLMFDYKAYGYKSDTLLFATVTPPPEIPDRFSIAAKVTFMACADTCHPGAETLTLTFPTPQVQPGHFEAAEASLPPAAELPGARAHLSGSELVIDLPAPADDLVFIPDGNHYNPNVPQRRNGGQLRVPLIPEAPVPPGATRVDGLLGDPATRQFERVSLPLEGPDP